MAIVKDLIDLMLVAYETTDDELDYHKSRASDTVRLETWCMRGGLTPPCEIFRISIFANGALICGMLVYLRISDSPTYRIDVMSFSSRGSPLHDARFRQYHQPKKYLHIVDTEHNYTSVDLEMYAHLNRIDGGWDHVLSQLNAFVKMRW